MKNFYHMRYRFYKPHQKEHKIFAISDVHFSERTTDSLSQLAAQAEQEKPQIITLSGDLIDSLESVDDPHELGRISAWLHRLGKVAPVCLCLGNHDYYRKPADFKSGLSKSHHYVAERNDKFIATLNEVENVHLLDDSTFKNDEFYVFGLTLPPSYYRFDYVTEKRGNIFDPGTEDIGILLKKLDELSEHITKLPAKKTKICLIHSPVHLMNESVKAKLQEFDFVFAGHMHNGVVPPLLNEIWRGHRGIITPSKHLFVNHNTRTGLYGDNTIVLGAVTTIQKGAKPLSFLNSAFPVNYATIETTRNETYARKPDIRKKYINW